MAFGTPGSRSQARGPSPGFRFSLYAILSFVVMFLDQRHGWMEQARFALQAAAYPIQLAVSSPTNAWGWMRESFETRDALRAENERLKEQDRVLAIRSMRYEALARENGELRGLRDALPPVAEKWLAAEIVNIEINSLRQRVLINRGSANGVFKAQALLDDKGVIGQITHVGPWSAEAILITDPEHAIPVEIERTGLRTIAVGSGDAQSLALPYLPGNADVKSGDLLLTSGLGGVFPAGYPVAHVTEVHRDAVQPLAQVRATPFANVDTDREVVLVWFRADHPAAPTSGTTGDLKTGNPKLQPQAAPPPRPKPAIPANPDASAPAATTPTTPAGTDSRNSTRPSGTVNVPAAAPSKTGTPAAAATPGGSPSAAPPNTPKEPAAGENAPAAAPKEPSPDATPRNP
ncbi:MAG TPA: rod shape-determining protein MreC [Steroidobacteraceae bacterium]|nr:rod shape-determining protein MreC [Steroidobacteraceae bacterium]